MTKDEALKLALKALQSDDYWTHVEAVNAIHKSLAQQCVCGEPNSAGTHRTDGPCLAPQPEQQEPVAWRVSPRYEDLDGYFDFTDSKETADTLQQRGWEITPLYTTPPQPEHLEPVAHSVVEPLRPDEYQRRVSVKWVVQPVAGPLYTAPPQRTWVGLTNDEIWKDDAIMSANSGYGATFDTLRDIVRAVEAKLKEKNT